MSFFPKARVLGQPAEMVPAGSLDVIRAGFCSHRDDDGEVVFDCQYFPFLWWRWTVCGDERAHARLLATLARKRRAGITHIVCDPPDGSIYDADFMDELPNWMGEREFKAHFLPMVQWVRAQGFFPIIYCYAGGQADAVHIYDGQLERMLRWFVEAGVHTSSWFLWAWESFGATRECTAKQNVDAWRVMRRVLGPDARIAGHVDSGGIGRFTWASFLGVTEVGESIAGGVAKLFFDEQLQRDRLYWVESDDPSGGDEIGAMRMRLFDALFTQCPITSHGPTPEALERQVEGFERFAPDGTMMPALGRAVRTTGAPFWFAGMTPPLFVFWEPSIPFPYIRHDIDDAKVREVQAWANAHGMVHQGCMAA